MNLDGFSGFTCNVGDVETMIKRSLEILSNPETLRKFKDQAYIQAKKFELGNILPMYEEVYESLCTAHRLA